MKISSSPVVDTLKNIVQLNRKHSKAVYLQLAEQIASAIQTAILDQGAALPGTRQLAESLQVHRKTIVAAYEELAAQGLVTMIANKGTYINRDILAHFSESILPEDKKEMPENILFSIPNNRILELEKKERKGDFVLDDGKMDLRLFHTQKWDIGFSNIWKKEHFSDSFLKHQIAEFVLDVHSLTVKPEQIMLTPNKSLSIALVMQSLLRPNDIVVVAAPGDYKLNMAIQQTGGKLISIPVEPDGLDIAALEDLCKKQTIRMVCVSPQHHYPTTSILSYAKRLELLRLAEQYGFVILEEDSDGYFDFQKRKIPSLVALDTIGLVVHIHSFEQIVGAAWNMSYVLASSIVLKEMLKYKSYFGLEENGFPERIMANVLQSGSLQRITKKLTKTYLQRRNTLCQLLSTYWSQYAQYEVPKNGLAVWVSFDWDFNLAAFSKKCAANALAIPNHLLYQSQKWNGMRMGFGNWEEEEVEKIILMAKKSF